MSAAGWWEEVGIILKTHPGVWTPTYFARIFAQLMGELVTSRMREAGQCRVLDFGCGSGILAISAAGLGAEVTATDLNPTAVEVSAINAELNRVSVEVRLGDCFEPVARQKFDLIVANTPSIPGRVDAERRTANEWNENGNGRLLLDAVLTQGSAYLYPGGRLLTANNSEQGMNTTLALLDSHWAGHRILRRCTFDLDLAQFEPFREEWIRRGLAQRLGDRLIHHVHFIEAWV